MTFAVLIVNPRAGRGRAGTRAAACAAAFRNDGWRTQIVTCASPDEGTAAASTAARTADVVIACGGDGTVNAVLQGVVGTDAAMSILPCGTGNDLAATLGITGSDIAHAAAKIEAAPVVSIDVARATTADGNQRWFLGVLTTGFDSNVNDRANRMTWPTGTARYVSAMLAELRTFTPRAYTVTIDGEDISGPGMLVSVGNGPRYGGGMRICPGADLTDGTLDLTWLGAVSRGTLLKVFPRVFNGTHVRHRAVTTHRGRQMRLDAPGQTAYADGERIGPLPVTVTVHRAALRVKAPLA